MGNKNYGINKYDKTCQNLHVHSRPQKEKGDKNEETANTLSDLIKLSLS